MNIIEFPGIYNATYSIDLFFHRREKREVPFIVTACVREVEKRGMSEVGLYRVSGSASDVAKLRKSFESNSYEAEQLLKEVNIMHMLF